MNPIVIALLGPAGAGKTTISDYLIKKYGAKRYSLAGPLKEIAQRVLNFSDDQLYGSQDAKEMIDSRYGFSARWFLQRLGTEGCRAVMGTNIWTNTCLDQIKREMPSLAVIDDMRFIDESETLRCDPMLSGKVWRLFPPAENFIETTMRDTGAHATETEWKVAPADADLRPARRGIPELLEVADMAFQRTVSL